MRVLIVGCGYIGSKLGSDLVRQGHQVFGVLRNPRAAAALSAAGIVPILLDVSVQDNCAGLPRDCDWVVLCVSSRGGGVPEYEQTYLHCTRNLIEFMAATSTARFVFTSSTSVYGQNDGSSVDETSPTDPEAGTAQILLRAERLLRKAVVEHCLPVVVLRLAGIYGPQRTHWLDRLRNGLLQSEFSSNRILNMIHRDDAAGAVLAAFERGSPGQVYNAVDDGPVDQATFLQWLAANFGNSGTDCRILGTSAIHRAATSKRVSNRKLKEELGYRLKFPTFRQGYLSGLTGPLL